jgi:hypothetical protein
MRPKLKPPGIARLKLVYDDLLLNVAFKLNARRYSVVAFGIEFIPSAYNSMTEDTAADRNRLDDQYDHPMLFCYGQGLTLVHTSAQPEPISVIEAAASVHFPAQPEPFL